MLRCNRLHFLIVLFPALLAAQGPWDQTFPKDVPAPEGFRENRTTYSALMELMRPKRTGVSDAQLETLSEFQLEAVWGAMGDYRETNFVRGFQSTQPGKRLVGRALTIRFLPFRKDLDAAARELAKEGDWDRRFYIRAGEEAKPGDVVVVDLGGTEGNIFFGDVTALGIALRGAKGVIIDGGTRDLAELSDEPFKDFPVFARFFDVNPARWVGAEWNVPIRVGSATVLPGDIVVADAEGILFVPPDIVAGVIESAVERKKREDYERDLLRQKKYRVRDVYPLHPELRKKYEEQQK